jgi:hypothetical protein
VCRVGSDLWKATSEHPDSPDLILHIEVGAPLGEGGLGRPVTKHEEPPPPQASRSMSLNPSNDSAVFVPFGELYVLTHTIQRNDAFREEDKEVSDSSEWREPV